MSKGVIQIIRNVVMVGKSLTTFTLHTSYRGWCYWWVGVQIAAFLALRNI